jgi:hypothetical protein
MQFRIGFNETTTSELFCSRDTELSPCAGCEGTSVCLMHNVYSSTGTVRYLPVLYYKSPSYIKLIIVHNKHLSINLRGVTWRKFFIALPMQAGHAACAACPQNTGCTHANATTDSCDSQSHGYVKRQQSSDTANAAREGETATWVSSLCVSVQDAQTTQSLLKLADLARDATSVRIIHSNKTQTENTLLFFFF